MCVPVIMTAALLAACGGVDNSLPPASVVSDSPALPDGNSDSGGTPAPSADTTKPTVSISTPQSNATVSGSAVSISASAADNVGVAGVQFRVNDSIIGVEDTTTPYSMVLDTTKISNGSYTLTAVARDGAGNVATSTGVKVNVTNTSADTTPPSVPSGLTATPVASFQINLSWNAATDNVGVAGYRIYRDGSAIGTTSQRSFSVAGLSAQTKYTFFVVAYDAANNSSAQSTAVASTTLSGTVGTSLADLAARLGRGEWGELVTLNFDPDTLLFTSASENPTFSYADEAIWDPASHQLLFIGSGHGDNVGLFIRYAEATNAWTVMPQQSFVGNGTTLHAYDHQAIDTKRGHYYHRPLGGTAVHRYNISTGSWDRIADIPLDYYPPIASGLEYFPEMDGLIFVSGRGQGISEVYFYSMAGGSWSKIASGLSMGDYHNFSEYDPVHKVILFGGGAGSSDVYSLDASGKVAKKKSAPVELGIRRSVIVGDPASGRLLVFAENGTSYEYDVVTDAWKTIGSHDLKDSYNELNTVAAPVPNYGVTIYVKADFSKSKVLVYKHTD